MTTALILFCCAGAVFFGFNIPTSLKTEGIKNPGLFMLIKVAMWILASLACVAGAIVLHIHR